MEKKKKGFKKSRSLNCMHFPTVGISFSLKNYYWQNIHINILQQELEIGVLPFLPRQPQEGEL